MHIIIVVRDDNRRHHGRNGEQCGDLRLEDPLEMPELEETVTERCTLFDYLSWGVRAPAFVNQAPKFMPVIKSAEKFH